ncbi:MAG: hypothetical protein ACREIV_09130, partial [Planctomycetaceae bacterium]
RYGYSPSYYDPTQPWFYDFSGSVFTSLKRMAQPEHHWGVIYLLSFGYVLLVFPGFYLLGRRRLDYRIVYGAFLGTVAAFSAIFAFVGRRGYGESTHVHSLAIAQSLPAGAWDVHAWSNAFVTDGDMYTITHGGSGRLYSTAQSEEAVKGEIRGTTGEFIVDVPPFSSRSFTHRIKLKSRPFAVTAADWAADERLKQLTVETGPAFPQPALGTQVFALYRDRLYEMKRENGRLVKRAGNGFTVAQYLGTIDFNQFQYYGPFGQWEQEDETETQRYRKMHKPLIARSLNLNNLKSEEEFELPADRVRLIVFAPMPENFHIQNDQFGRQSGHVLYLIDVVRPEPQ